MADDLRLNIRSSLDATGIRAGSQESADAVEAAASKISAANAGIAASSDRAASAAAELAQRFMQQGMSAKDAEGALIGLGYSAREAATVMTGLAGATENVERTTVAAAAGITGLDRAMAQAGVRIVAMESGLGGMGYALGRVASQSSVLGPILAAAFPVAAVVALVAVIEAAVEKVIKWREELNDTAIAVGELSEKTQIQSERLDLENLKLDEQIAKLEHRPGDGLAVALEEARIKAMELGSEIESTLAKTAKLFEVGVISRIVGTASAQFDATLKSLELQYAMALAANDVEAQKNILLQEQIAIRKQIANITPISQGGKASEAPSARKDTEIWTLNEALKAVNLQLEDFNKLTEIANKSSIVGGLKGAGKQPEMGAQHEREMELMRKEAEEELKSLEKISEARDKAALKAELDHDAEVDASIRAAQKELEVFTKAQQERDRVYAKSIADAEDRAEKAMERAAKLSQKHWDDAFKTINRAMDDMVKGIMMGTQTLGQAFSRLGANMLISITEALLKILMKWVEHEVIMLATHQAGNAAKTASDEEAAAQSGSIDLIRVLKQVTRSAVSAAGKAYEAFAAIPIVGPALGAAAAVATFAAVEGFGALASAAGGMVVPSDMLAMVHKNEMVLPANLSKGFQGMMAAGGAGGGGMTIHYAPQINSMDTAGGEAMLQRHAKALVRVIRKSARNGAF